MTVNSRWLSRRWLVIYKWDESSCKNLHFCFIYYNKCVIKQNLVVTKGVSLTSFPGSEWIKKQFKHIDQKTRPCQECLSYKKILKTVFNILKNIPTLAEWQSKTFMFRKYLHSTQAEYWRMWIISINYTGNDYSLSERLLLPQSK